MTNMLLAAEALVATQRKRRGLVKPGDQLARVLAAKWKADGAAAAAALSSRTGRRLLRAEAWRQVIGEDDATDLADLAAAAIDPATRQQTTDIAQALAAAADVGASGLAVELAVAVPQLAGDYAEARAAALLAEVDDTTRDRVRRLVTDAVREGASPARLARELTGMTNGWGRRRRAGQRTRAQLVATTEIGQAYEEGRHDVAVQLTDQGLVLEKRWLYVDDDRVSEPICKANGQQGWLAYGDSYQSGHDRPLGHPGCRCDQLVRSV